MMTNAISQEEEPDSIHNDLNFEVSNSSHVPHLLAQEDVDDLVRVSSKISLKVVLLHKRKQR
jgi:hypothetical protein